MAADTIDTPVRVRAAAGAAGKYTTTGQAVFATGPGTDTEQIALDRTGDAEDSADITGITDQAVRADAGDFKCIMSIE